MNIFKQLLCLFGFHKWVYIKINDTKNRYCSRCVMMQYLGKDGKYHN